MTKFLSRLLCVFCILGIASCDDSFETPDITDENDSYIGNHQLIRISDGLHSFDRPSFTCFIKAPDGSIIKREGILDKIDGTPTLNLINGLKDGEYQILYLEYQLDNVENEKYKKAHYGLGCKVRLQNGETLLLNNFSSSMNMYGSGTKEEPFIISSYSHLLELTFAIEDGDEEAVRSTYRQIADIDMDYASYRSDNNFGWLPIGTAANPFRGTYIGASTDKVIHTIKNLWSNTKDMSGVGFFGYIADAKIDSLNIESCTIKGDCAVGVLAGCVLQTGGNRVTSAISNCTVSNSSVSAYDSETKRNTLMMGGILGGLDTNAAAIISSCKIDNVSVHATCNAGGIVGGTGIYSFLSINDCNTTSTCQIVSEYSGVGGIVGSCDTLTVNGCRNAATIIGAQLYKPSESGTAGYGAGGICGGSTISFITASINQGSVSGYEGVGGIIGSTRVAGLGSESDPYVYNNTYLRYCGNEGAVNGANNVGGLCGEAQFGCYGGYNTGSVTGSGNYISGGVGNTSLAVVHNTVNSGNISGQNYVSGIVSKTEMGSIAFSQNFGTVTSQSNSSTHTGGICAIAINNSVFHHCGNFAKVLGNGCVGGIVGELGHIDETTGVAKAQTIMVVVDVASAFFVGPIIGVFIDGTAGALKRVLQVVSVSTSLILASIDSTLVIYPFTVHYDEQEWESIRTDVSETVATNMEYIEGTIAALRSDEGRSYALYNSSLKPSTIFTNYTNITNSQLDYYTTESNDSIINTNINKKRDELADDVSKVNKVSNIVHAAISGVAILATAIVSVASACATGGVSLVFTALGMATTVVGGATSVSQMIWENTNNAVIVSQCINAGEVTTKNKELYYMGGLVGHLADNGRVYDCLNTSGVQGGHFVGTMESRSSVKRCASVWKNSSSVSNIADLYYRNFGGRISDVVILDDATYDGGSESTISFEDLANPSAYPWSVGADKAWDIPSGASFAIPNMSEMRE